MAHTYARTAVPLRQTAKCEKERRLRTDGRGRNDLGSGEAGWAARTQAGHSRSGQWSRCVSTTAEVHSETDGSRPGAYKFLELGRHNTLRSGVTRRELRRLPSARVLRGDDSVIQAAVIGSSGWLCWVGGGDGLDWVCIVAGSRELTGRALGSAEAAVGGEWEAQPVGWQLRKWRPSSEVA
eukprot:6212221-Pleurochrysis_carterae.AAC.1